MDPRARVQFVRWRNECINHHTLQQSNTRGRPTVGQRRNEAPPNGAPRWDHSSRRVHRPLTPEVEPSRPRNVVEANNSSYHPTQPKPLPPHIRLHSQYTPPQSISQPIDPEWFREVSQVYGPEGLAQLRNDQFRVMQAQNSPNTSGYRPPQIVHAPPPPPPHSPIPVPVDSGQMAEFTRNAMMRAAQGRRRPTLTPRHMNVSGQTEMQ